MADKYIHLKDPTASVRYEEAERRRLDLAMAMGVSNRCSWTYMLWLAREVTDAYQQMHPEVDLSEIKFKGESE